MLTLACALALLLFALADPHLARWLVQHGWCYLCGLVVGVVYITAMIVHIAERSEE
jgi:uncharacterized membrane protein YdcZ (DUF606 family)